MKTYIIIDDEPIAHSIIETYCENLTVLKKVGNCYNAFEAMKALNEQQIDLIFLDINMPKLSGFEFLKTLENPPKIIVTTAYEEFALEGYELNISDYLLKPFSFARFVKAVNKAIKNDSGPKIDTMTTSSSTNDTIFIKGDKKIHQIHKDDILYVEAYGNYSKIHLRDNMILSHEKISVLEDMLQKENFLRVHKSFIVAINKIKYIEGNRLIIEDHKIPIGQTYKANIKKLY